MLIQEVTGGRENYWPLFLLADPSKDMVNIYLQDGFMLKAEENHETIGEIVVVPVSINEWERFQGRGIGRSLILSTVKRLQKGTALLVGTSTYGVGFYEKCGFTYYRTESDFFTKNYPEPIFENGEQCVDMIYLRQTL